MQGLSTIQKRLQETDPDMHAKQMTRLNLEIQARDRWLTLDRKPQMLRELLARARARARTLSLSPSHHPPLSLSLSLC